MLASGDVKPVVQHRCFHPQLSQPQQKLDRGVDVLGAKAPPPLLKRDESALGEVCVAQSSVHRHAVAQRPPGAMLPMDAFPRGFGLHSQADEASGNIAPALPLPKQYRAQAPPDVGIEVV